MSFRGFPGKNFDSSGVLPCEIPLLTETDEPGGWPWMVCWCFTTIRRLPFTKRTAWPILTHWNNGRSYKTNTSSMHARNTAYPYRRKCAKWSRFCLVGYGAGTGAALYVSSRTDGKNLGKADCKGGKSEIWQGGPVMTISRKIRRVRRHRKQGSKIIQVFLNLAVNPGIKPTINGLFQWNADLNGKLFSVRIIILTEWYNGIYWISKIKITHLLRILTILLFFLQRYWHRRLKGLQLKGLQYIPEKRNTMMWKSR